MNCPHCQNKRTVERDVSQYVERFDAYADVQVTGPCPDCSTCVACDVRLDHENDTGIVPDAEFGGFLCSTCGCVR